MKEGNTAAAMMESLSAIALVKRRLDETWDQRHPAHSLEWIKLLQELIELHYKQFMAGRYYMMLPRPAAGGEFKRLIE